MAKKKIEPSKLEQKIQEKNANARADFPTLASTIQELPTQNYIDFSNTDLVAVQSAGGTFQVSLLDLAKILSQVRSTQELSRPLWLDSVPLGAVMGFDVYDPSPSFRGAGNWVLCNGQTISEASYPLFFQFSGRSGQGSYILPNLNDFNLENAGSGYFARGVNPAVRLPGSTQEDALQNLTGDFRSSSNGFQSSGVFSVGNISVTGPGSFGGDDRTKNYTFDASRVARTSTETRAKNVGLVYYIKLDNEFI